MNNHCSFKMLEHSVRVSIDHSIGIVKPLRDDACDQYATLKKCEVKLFCAKGG